MKKYSKLRMVMFALVLILLPCAVLPMTAEEVSASEYVYLCWDRDYDFSQEYKYVEIEQGAEFYVGDYVSISGDAGNGCASTFSKVKYNSSNKSVITVNSKGLLKAKKTGFSTIKVKYKGKSVTRKFKVVKKGTFSDSEYAKECQKAVDALIPVIPKKITKSNAFKCTKALKAYYAAMDKVNEDDVRIEYDGYLRKTTTNGAVSVTSVSNRLAVPNAGRVTYLNHMLWEYGVKNNPVSTTGKGMKISSVSSSKKQIIIKLKKAVTAEQILAANIYNSQYNPVPNKTTAVVAVDLTDVKTSEGYIGLATIKKGSKTVKIAKGYSMGELKKLKKGHTYRIGVKYASWGNGKKVKLK